MKKYFLYTIILVGLSLFFISYIPAVSNPLPKINRQNEEQKDFTTKPDVAPQVGASGATTPTTTAPIIKKDESNTKNTSTQTTKTPVEGQKIITVTLTARGATYTAKVPENSTVFDTMKLLASTTPFRFHATYHSSFGYFIDEINGVKNNSNAFWIYYVNGTQANLGASFYTLKPNDSVVWRLEDSRKREVL